MIRKAVIILLTLAAVGTGAVYAVTVFMGFGYYHFGPGGNYSVSFVRGAFAIGHDNETVVGGFHMRYDPSSELIGIPRTITTPGSHAIIVPLWTPLVVFGAYPAVAFIRGPLRRWRRRRKGLCVKCGYNLTGLTEPRCPECGTEFARMRNRVRSFDASARARIRRWGELIRCPPSSNHVTSPTQRCASC
jgi:hypothetical protein